MSDLEPIELEFLINSPELLAELQAVSSGMKNHDEVVEKVVKRYDDLKKGQKEAGDSSGQMKGKMSDLGAEILKTGGSIDSVKDILGGFLQEVIVSNANVSTLTKIKEFWAAVNLRVATTLGISTAAAQALTATLTLGLSLVIGAIIVLYQNWQSEAAAAAEQQKKFGETVAQTASESISSFMALRAEWNALGNDLQAKQKFIEDNQDAFAKLGISVDNVGEAENVFRHNAAAMVNSLLERARAMAAMQLAAEELKKSLQTMQEVELRENNYKGSVFGGINRFVNEKIGGALGLVKTDDDAKRYEQNAVSFVNKKVTADKKANKIQRKANIREHEQNRKEAKTQLEKDAEVYKAHTGKKAYDILIQNQDNLIKNYKKGSKEYADAIQERKVLVAEKQHEADEAAKKAADKASAEAERARKKREAEQRKAEAEAKRRFEQQKSFLATLAKEENALNNRTDAETSAEAKVKSHFDQLREKAKTVGMLNADVQKRINDLEQKQLASEQYKQDTKKEVERLNDLRDAYAAYEVLKTQIGEEEAAKRTGISQQEFKTFSEIIDKEVEALKNKDNRDVDENARLKAYEELQKKFEKDRLKEDTDKFKDAYTAAITHEEKVLAAKKAFSERNIQLEKITDEKIRAAKLKESERMYADEIGQLNAGKMRQLREESSFAEQMIGINKKQMKGRLDVLKKMLNEQLYLNEEQKEKLQKSIAEGEGLLSGGISAKENYIYEQRRKVQEQINELKKKGNALTKEEKDMLARLNIAYQNWTEELDNTRLEKFNQIADWSQQLLSSFQELAAAIGDGNDEFTQMLALVAELANDATNVLNAFSKGIADGIVSLVAVAIKWVGKLFKMGKEARKSAEEAQRRIVEQRYAELEAHLAFNEENRQRLKTEIAINDVYQSRIEAIKEEMALNKKNKEGILKDSQSVFDKLLKSQTLTDVTAEKKKSKWQPTLFFGAFGAFLPRKTKTVEHYATVAEQLGIKEGTQLTDDLLKKLDELNAKKPLTGDAKEAYEQLKKLRDEYGSIEQAQRELEKQLKDTVTGTTAQALADSIREGILSGKKSFADFADDIENFLRQGIIAGMSAKVIEPQIQKLQDELYNFLGDGVLSSEEKAQFQQMYMKIAAEAKDYLDMINQSGISMTTTTASANSLQGAYKTASQESITLLAGQTGGMRVAQLETNQILKAGAAQQLAQSSKMLEVQMNIELNTRKTAENTEKTAENTEKIDKTLRTQYNDLKANGII